MSITWLPREQGLVVKCNGHACTTKYFSAAIMAGNVREWIAKHDGWGRGSRAGTKTRFGTKRHDLRPPCLALDKELAAQDAKEKAERKEKRDEARKARFRPGPKPKKPRKKKASPTATPSPTTCSPSVDSAPAASTP